MLPLLATFSSIPPFAPVRKNGIKRDVELVSSFRARAPNVPLQEL